MTLKFVVFGLTMSSSWGNGHATLWRGLVRELHALGHRVVFFERDLPYYATHRDLVQLDDAKLVLYPTWEGVESEARRELDNADVGIITSYCPDAIAAGDLLVNSRVGAKVFYDLDTPVTLASLGSASGCPYIGKNGLRDFDLVLSFTGGRALSELSSRLGAKRAVPLLGWVDPTTHTRTEPVAEYSALLSYLGTHAEDRRQALEDLFCEPARRLPGDRFVLAGALYPTDFCLPSNVSYIDHLAPAYHGAFFSSSQFTLNLTRRAMKDYGYCPSGRLFEAAACGATIITDDWLGLDSFFEPQREILIAKSTDDVLTAVRLPESIRRHVGEAARQRTLAEHTALSRARSLVAYVTGRAGSEALAPEKPALLDTREHSSTRLNGTALQTFSSRTHEEI